MSKQPVQTEQSDGQSKPANNNERRWAVAAIVAAVTVGLIIVLGYILPGEWGGFTEYTTPKSDTVEYHPRRTLWDLLSLLVIPAVLLIAGALFTRFERENDNRLAWEKADVDRELAEKRSEKDREMAATNLRDAALREYFDRMSDLLLNHELVSSSHEDPVRDVARTRTLTILRALRGDGERKGSVVRFLYEAELISAYKPVIYLEGADLGEADLHKATLETSCLQKTNLEKANLEGTDLRGANLQGANLQGANLRDANLETAYLIKADLQNGELERARFFRANLLMANLQGANLESTNLQEADLRSTNLQGIKLQGAILVKANLEGANLEGANLEKANLEGAILDGAVLQWANLEGATVTGEQLARSRKLRVGITGRGTPAE